MSWSVEGRMYHDHAAYQKALARATEARLRKAVERLRIPAADTSSLEGKLAAAQARDHAVRRLAAQAQRQTAERQAMAEAHRERIGEAFQEVEREEERLQLELDGWRASFGRDVEELERQRMAQAAAVSASLEQELAADRRDDATAQRRRQDLLVRAEAVLDRLPAERLADLGLDASPLRGLLERARQDGGAAGLDLARRAYDQSCGLESEATYREGRLAALREVYTAEVESLGEALSFSPEDRADLVGDGDAALDAPLRQELDRIRDRVRNLRRYEDHEARCADIGKVLDRLSVQVADLAAQVRDFDQLEANRLELIRHRLGAKLEEVLGDGARLLEVTPGALGLQPVEARFCTAKGEKVDCSVCIDGTLRIHHYEHVSQASCAESARALARQLPELMAMTGQPSLDVAAAAAPREGGAGRAPGSREAERSSS